MVRHSSGGALMGTPLLLQVDNFIDAIQFGLIGQDWSTAHRDTALLTLTIASRAVSAGNTQEATDHEVDELLNCLNQQLAPA
jgi:hypothetical protein